MIDLLNIETYRENNRIEAKRAAGGFPHSLWETYSAFANTIGGLILLGVEEAEDKSFRVVGVPDSAGYLDYFWSYMNDPQKINVNILSPDDVSVQVLDGKEIIVIQVPRANRHDRPVFLNGNPFTGSFRRDGEGDYHCTSEEVRSMLRDRDDTPADLAPLTTLTLDDLSLDSLHAFRSLMSKRKPNHPFSKLSDREFLLETGALVWDHKQKALHPTVAGLLLFGHLPALKQAFSAYRLEYQEDVPDGILFRSGEGNWSGNLFDFYQRVSTRLSDVSETISPQNPELAASLQEAAVNAILHADYFGRHGLHILRLPDAIQVTNDGLLRVPPTHIRKGHVAESRNIGLTRLFALIGVASGTGTGLKGIYHTWAKQGFHPPVLTELFGPDTISLHLPLYGFAKDKLQQKIVDHLTWAISARSDEISQSLHVSPIQIQLALYKLRQEGLVSGKQQNGHMVYSLRA